MKLEHLPIVTETQRVCVCPLRKRLLQISSPACTELEVVMMDWLAKLLKLPEQFMSGGKGGGVIQVHV